MIDLEAMLRCRQDELRGRPLTRWERFRERLPHMVEVVEDWTIYGGLFLSFALMLFTWVLLIYAATHANARDIEGRYANSDLKPWFDGLRSGKGPCCSDADGSAVSDADWRTKDGRYQVRLDVSRVAPKVDMQWIDVPDDAVITEPNKAGKTMVWPIFGYMGVSIRCFMPGSMG